MAYIYEPVILNFLLGMRGFFSVVSYAKGKQRYRPRSLIV